MKIHYGNCLIVFVICLCLGFGGSCKTTPQQELDKARRSAVVTANQIDTKETQIDNKGKSFLYAGIYANKQETNRTVAIDVSSRFLDLAQLTFGNPSVKDATTMRNVVDGLLLEKNLREETYKITLASKDSDIQNAQKEIVKYKAKINEAERTLSLVTDNVSKLQTDKENLEKTYKDKLEKVEKVNDANAVKASQYDQEHTFWNAINPFYDLKNLIKKLAILGTIGGVLVGAFRILEMFFPELNIVGAIFGFFGKWIFRFAPKAKKFAGVVSNEVWTAFKSNVKALEEGFRKLTTGQLEQEILNSVSDDAKLSKNELAKILGVYSDKVELLIKSELSKYNNEKTNAVVLVAQSELGIKQIAHDAQHLV